MYNAGANYRLFFAQAPKPHRSESTGINRRPGTQNSEYFPRQPIYLIDGKYSPIFTLRAIRTAALSGLPKIEQTPPALRT
jgi:hypothetical protein